MHRVMLILAVSGLAALALAVGPGTEKTAEKPLQRRIAERTYPSVFQAWNPAENVKGESKLVTVARHDLIFHGPGFFGLRWKGKSYGLATALKDESIVAGRKRRTKLLKLNPNLVLLAEIRYRDAWKGFLPAGHKWWMRGRDGKAAPGWAEGKFLKLDYTSADYRAHVAARCKAVVASGVVDGVMLDWWRDDEHRLALIKAVRAAVGEKALIVANANDRTTPKTASYINGYFMECTRSKTPADWKRIARTLRWAEHNLRKPRVNCLETWFHRSRRDLHLMRATTTLALTHSDGYCLFGDPNPLPTPDHLHDWYPFWRRSLGRPKAKGRKRDDGAWQREFDKGTAVYNPMGNAKATVVFATPYRSLRTGKVGRTHELPACDGDIYLRNTD